MQRRLRIRSEGITRVRTPDVRAYWARQTGTVFVIVEKIVFRICFPRIIRSLAFKHARMRCLYIKRLRIRCLVHHTLRIRSLPSRLFRNERIAVSPSAEQACRDPVFILADAFSHIRKKRIERRDILLELSKDKVSAIPSDVPALAVGDARPTLVQIAKQELAGFDLRARP